MIPENIPEKSLNVNDSINNSKISKVKQAKHKFHALEKVM